jgi:[glutamine synthetase] adenylyltransferase / [glutamine synthetase]-adenylyl-L-tyrosine phosphorylase
VPVSKPASRQSAVWTKAIQAAAEPERVRHYLEQFAATALAPALRAASEEQARILAALFCGSPAMSDWLVKHPDWFSPVLELGHLVQPRHAHGLRREIDTWLPLALQNRDYSGAAARLRQFRQREMLRIAARDLGRLADTVEIIREISDVAEVCLATVLRICRQQLTERFGQPFHQDAEGRGWPTQFCVLGLGKLGGHELNYSSDVDVIFVYSDEGNVFKEPPRKGARLPESGLSNHQFFKRLAESFIAEVTRATVDGGLFRIDLRLRPEGDAGPLVRSLASYENYYAQWGQTWERMMLVKARGVAGDDELAAEFLELVTPFRYPRSVNENVLREVAAMKERIEAEVVRSGEIDRNVKLGRGGIREIEFVAQTSQLLHAGHLPFLQGAQTLPVLQKLVSYNLLPAADARALREAYCFLRNVEHRLQMEQNLQTHTIPHDRKSRERLARLMGFTTLADFEAARAQHTDHVRQVYDRLLKSEASPPVDHPEDLSNQAWWKSFLADRAFKQVDKSFKLLHQFIHGPGFGHVSPRTEDLAWLALARLLSLCPKIQPDGRVVPRNPDKPQVLSDPDRVLARLDSFIAAYGSRAMLFETWASNPLLFELLVLLFDRSEFLAETAIRTPDLVDDLVLSGRLGRRKTASETLADLRHGLDDADQYLWLRRYHEVEFMRLGLRDILGLVDFEQNLLELSNLADACLQYALEVVLKKARLKTSPIAILGLGKVGGQEVTYGSDLDIVFVADCPARELPKLQRLAGELMDLLSKRTEQGIVFNTDARLRPDGEKGQLVNTLGAYEEYYRQRAQLWEIQSLSRSRAVAGNAELGRRFQEMAARLTDFRTASVESGFSSKRRMPQAEATKAGAKKSKFVSPRQQSGLAAYTPDWKAKIAHMRQRIEKERTPLGQDALAIKTGAGGLMDAEFIAQALSLEHGWHEANTQRALERARDTGALPRAEADRLVENYRHLRRIEGILRRWSFEGETELPLDSAPYYRVSVRCGFSTPEAFRDALAGYRQAMREIYRRVFPG